MWGPNWLRPESDLGGFNSRMGGGSPALALRFDTTRNDPAELLTESAASRLAALRQHVADVHVLIPVFEDVRQARTAKLEAERALNS